MYNNLCLSKVKRLRRLPPGVHFRASQPCLNIVRSEGSCAVFCPYFVNFISARHKGAASVTVAVTPIAAHPAHREKERERERLMLDRGREADVFFRCSTSFSQTQPGDIRGGMMVASACPRSTIGLPAMSSVIYDAVKMYTVFSVASPRVTVLS